MTKDIKYPQGTQANYSDTYRALMKFITREVTRKELTDLTSNKEIDKNRKHIKELEAHLMHWSHKASRTVDIGDRYKRLKQKYEDLLHELGAESKYLVSDYIQQSAAVTYLLEVYTELDIDESNKDFYRRIALDLLCDLIKKS